MRDYPIAIVGAGGIVNDAHLPAYRKAGFDVIGIYDVRAARRPAGQSQAVGAYAPS